MKTLKQLFFILMGSLLISCGESGPRQIELGKDQCDECKMTITDAKYATQLVTQKGRWYKFDDINCMNSFEVSNPEYFTGGKTYVADFPSGELIETETATLISGGSIKSPMGGNTQAFRDPAAADKAAAALGATVKK